MITRILWIVSLQIYMEAIIKLLTLTALGIWSTYCGLMIA